MEYIDRGKDFLDRQVSKNYFEGIDGQKVSAYVNELFSRGIFQTPDKRSNGSISVKELLVNNLFQIMYIYV